MDFEQLEVAIRPHLRRFIKLHWGGQMLCMVTVIFVGFVLTRLVCRLVFWLLEKYVLSPAQDFIENEPPGDSAPFSDRAYWEKEYGGQAEGEESYEW